MPAARTTRRPRPAPGWPRSRTPPRCAHTRALTASCKPQVRSEVVGIRGKRRERGGFANIHGVRGLWKLQSSARGQFGRRSEFDTDCAEEHGRARTRRIPQLRRVTIVELTFRGAQVADSDDESIRIDK